MGAPASIVEDKRFSGGLPGTISEASGMLAAGKVSSQELTKAYLARIQKYDTALGAFVTVTEKMALQQAAESDVRRAKKQPKGVLDGIPGALKDVITTREVRTTASSKILESFVPPYEAHVATLLRNQGMVLLGKTNLDEFAMGTTTEYSSFGPTRNPWHKDHVAGGSSGGSAAAVAARMSLLALGTDTGGSIRLPASWTGVVGLRPTYGRVSRNGVIAMASSLDQVGTLTASVSDAAILLEAIASNDPHDSTHAGKPIPAFLHHHQTSLHGKRIGVVKEFFGSGIDTHVASAVQQAIDQLERLGARVSEVSLPLVEYALAVYCILVPAEVSTNLERYDGIRYGYSALKDATAHSLLDVYYQTRARGFGSEAKRRIMLGSYVLSAGYYDHYYTQALKVRRLIREQFSNAFETYDCLVGPVCPSTAFAMHHTDDPLKLWMTDILAVPVNIAGLPGLSIPCGMHHGLPVGLQLIADQFNESALFDIASSFEASTDWHTKQPDMEVHYGQTSAK